MSANRDYQILEAAKRRMVDENVPWLDENGVRIVSAKVETHPKHGLQCIIILKPESGDLTGAGKCDIENVGGGET